MSGKLPEGWEDALPSFTPEDKGLATRLHSQNHAQCSVQRAPRCAPGSSPCTSAPQPVKPAAADLHPSPLLLDRGALRRSCSWSGIDV